MKRILHTPAAIGLVYLLLIFVFAVVYWGNPQFWAEPLSFVQGLYFSVVTITTLGYGDISPQTEWARVWTAAEALSGVVIIGWFLISVARHLDDTRDAKRKEMLRTHLLAKYTEYKRDLVGLCLRAAKGSDYQLQEELVDYKKFREHFVGENHQIWYDVLNGFQYNTDLLKELFVVMDLFVRQVDHALGNMHVEDQEALAVLTRVSQRPPWVKHSGMTSGDPAKYVGEYLLEVLAMCNTWDGALDGDYIEESIRRL